MIPHGFLDSGIARFIPSFPTEHQQLYEYAVNQPERLDSHISAFGSESSSVGSL